MQEQTSSNSLGERVPKLRFPGFEGEWDFELFSDLFTFLSNNTLSRAELSETGNIRNIHYGDILVRYTDVINIDDEIIPFVSNNSEGKVRCDVLRTGDVIITDTAEDDTVGKAIEIINHNNKSVVSGLHTMPCRPNRDFTASFLGYYINSNTYHSQLYPYMQGIKVTSISKANIGKTLIHFPSRSEQKKIVGLFNLIEKKILIQKKLVEAIKLYKRGLLSKLFSQKGESVPQYRFAGFTDAWEQRKLGELCEVTMGQSPDGSTYSDEPSDYILVQGNADLKDGWVFPRIWTTQKTKTAQAGDLIMGVRAPAGAMGKTAYDVVLGRGVAGIKGNEFVYQTLVKFDSDGYWKKLAAGSTFESVNSDAVKGAILLVPQDVEEQEKIGQYFSHLDRLITLHQRKCNEMQSIKKFMLQNMFV